MQIHFSLPVAEGRTLQRKLFSIAISTWFHFAQYKMVLWQIMVNHVIRIHFISFLLLNYVQFVYYICEQNEMMSTNYILLCFCDHQIMGILFVTSTTI
jgi:hypothetical protein